MKTCQRLMLIAFFLFQLNSFCYPRQPEPDPGRFIIVMNMQKHFTGKLPSDSVALKIINTVNNLLDKSETDKILYVRSVLTTLSISLKGFDVDTLPNLEPDESVSIKNENIFFKDKANAFKINEINHFLKRNNAREIIVVGFMAEHSVYKTLLGGKKEGYDMYVLPAAIGGKSEEAKNEALTRLSGKGVTIIKD